MDTTAVEDGAPDGGSRTLAEASSGAVHTTVQGAASPAEWRQGRSCAPPDARRRDANRRSKWRPTPLEAPEEGGDGGRRRLRGQNVHTYARSALRRPSACPGGLPVAGTSKSRGTVAPGRGGLRTAVFPAAGPRPGSWAPDCCVHAVFYSMNCTFRRPARGASHGLVTPLGSPHGLVTPPGGASHGLLIVAFMPCFTAEITTTARTATTVTATARATPTATATAAATSTEKERGDSDGD